MATILGIVAADLNFCSGATEANNWALFSLAARAGAEKKEILVSPVEHPSVLEPLGRLVRQGFKLRFLPVDAGGLLRLDEAQAMLTAATAFSSLMWINNETGVIQPVHQWAEACTQAGVPYHCDAVQAVGRIAVDLQDLPIDILTFSAHKFHGPTGAGGLVARNPGLLKPLLLGGGQERERRPGTENLLAIEGMAKALDLATTERQQRLKKVSQLAERLLKGLIKRAPGVILNTAETRRWPGVLNLRIPNRRGETLLMKLDLAGVAVSLGSACSSGAIEPSHVLKAMGLSDLDNLSSLRVSLAHDNDQADVESFLNALVPLLSLS